jgi:hypothetical protein
MCTTYTGRLVMPTNFGVPSALDIAISLGRECRWAGSVRVWWSVLHHVRAMCDMAAEMFVGEVPEDVRAHILLHDAHEAILRDVPSTWKTNEQRGQEQRLDARIYEAYLGGLPSLDTNAQVKALDILCLRGECSALLPAATAYNAGINLDHQLQHTMDMRRVVMQLHGEYATPDSSVHENSPLVRWYIEELRGLVSPGRWAVYGDHTNDAH